MMSIVVLNLFTEFDSSVVRLFFLFLQCFTQSLNHLSSQIFLNQVLTSKINFQMNTIHTKSKSIKHKF